MDHNTKEATELLLKKPGLQAALLLCHNASCEKITFMYVFTRKEGTEAESEEDRKPHWKGKLASQAHTTSNT